MRGRTRASCTVVAMLLSAVVLRAEEITPNDLEDALQLLLNQALSVEISARIVENGQETVWTMELSRVTISGRAVTVRLDGSNVVVVVQFTPYIAEDSSVLLVAQGQTWVTTSESQDAVYRTAFRSIPINLGEPVVFLPLGNHPIDVNVDTDTDGAFNIELEVRVEPYVGMRTEE